MSADPKATLTFPADIEVWGASLHGRKEGHMRHRTIITLAATGMFILFFAISAKAHSPSEIESWEQEWEQFATSLPASTNPALASALQHELDRARYWFEYHHQCHYFEICPSLSTKAGDKPLGTLDASQPTNGGMGNQTSDVERWRGLVSAFFPGEVDLALCVMRLESGGNPNARNPSSGAAGLFQIMPFWWDHYGGSRYDPETNVRVASYIRAAHGWTAWAAYNRGKC